MGFFRFTDLRQLVRSTRLALRTVKGAGWSLMAVTLTTAVLLGLVPVAMSLAMANIIGAAPGVHVAGLNSDEGTRLMVATVAYVVFLTLQGLVGSTSSAWAAWVRRQLDGRLRERVMRATTAPHGLRHLEDPALQSVLEAARRAAPGTGMSPGTIAGVLPSVLAYRIGLLARLIGLTYLAWPIGLAYAVVTVKSQDEMQRAIWRVAGGGGGVPPKEVGYQLDLATSAAPGKELRVFGLGQWVGDRYQSGMRAHIASVWERRRDFTPSLIVTLGLAAVVHIVALLVMGRSALRGELGIGELAFAMSSVMALIPFFNQDDMPLAFATTTLETIEEAERIVADRTLRIGGTRRAERLPARSIRFEEVRFAYPGGAEVLAGVDLELRSDERTALVGLNGAGKTTLVKLLCGMYEPTAGRITIDDGIPLTELDPVAWRRQLAVLFQDFSRFELAARDNIRYGAIHWDGDVDGAVERAAAAAGISGVLGSLPAAFDSPLAPGYEHGVDLSGGQWQRVALARALFAVDAGAQVLVLDEPTANLDVRAEADFFQTLLTLTSPALRQEAKPPLTTLMISHRFSTVRQADRIVVLSEGRIAEEGTHAELVEAGDTYARLFRAQADQYAAAREDSS